MSFGLPVLHFCCKHTVEIVVDLAHAERNREVFVFVFSGKKHEGKLHNGVSIELLADPRDVRKGLYKAFLMPNNCDVFLQCPSQPAAFTLDHPLMSASDRAREVFCDRVQEGRDIARNAIQQTAARTTKNILLKFPAYLRLSNAIYSPSLKDGEIKLISTSYFHDTELGSKTYANIVNAKIAWRLHVVDATERIVEDEEDEDTYEDDLVRGLESTGMR